MTRRIAPLHKYVADFISEVKERCPDARIRVSYQPYETEDANLKVYLPATLTDEDLEKLADDTAVMMSDLLEKTGYSIPILLVEDQDRVRQEKEAFLAARQRRAS